MSTVAGAKRPGAVTASYVIWLIGAILALIGSAFAVVLGLLALTGGAVVGGIYGAAAGSIVLMFAIFILILAIVELVIVNRMRDGRNWARVTLTVLGILSLLGTAAAAFNGSGNSASSSGLLGGVIVLVAIILMFLPASNAYFAARSGR